MRYIIFCCLLPFWASAQFPPAAGQAGSTALHKDSVQWVCWANACQVQRGYMDISNVALGFAASGSNSDACGVAGEGGVLSLGDAGEATLQFPYPIQNGSGADFAVFENAFSNTFLELAFVEVSSDGQHFVRFPSISNTDTSVQVGSFGAVNASQIHNLAGKYRAGYGTPFDLEDLKDSVGIDVQHITHIRLIDVVGCIQPNYARRDSRGIIVNDPWNTPFDVSGFDLDAVGVIHAQNPAATLSIKTPDMKLFPNPVRSSEAFYIEFEWAEKQLCQIFTLQGQCLYQNYIHSGTSIHTDNWPAGLYLVQIGQQVSRLEIRY